MGRPSSYSLEIADEICQRLAAGESLRAICRDEKMPDERTVRRWVIDDVCGFSPHYARAREMGLDAMAEDVIEISDDGRNDWMEKFGRDGEAVGYELNGEHVQRSKLRVDSRKWLLSKLAPKKYGERSALELTGANGGPVVISDEERAEKVAALLAAAQQRKADGSDLV